MKVEKKKGFSPITITLETEEEAEALWYMLVCDNNESLKACLKKNHVKSTKQEEILKVNHSIFDNYNDVCDVDDDC